MSTLSTTSKRSDIRTSDTRVTGAQGTAPAMRRSAARAPMASVKEPPGSGAVRPFLRRWLTAAMLLVAALLATLYISNVIAVNDLMVSIASLEHDRDAARANNERLRAELLKLIAVDKVTSAAAARLGMVQPAQPPQTLTAGARAALPQRSISGQSAPEQTVPNRDSAVVR